MDAAYFLVPFVAGVAAMVVRLPPMIGFLAAGFALNAMGYEAKEPLLTIADLGVTLLLFTIGLKLNVRTLLRKEVWGTSSLHVGGYVVLVVGVLSALKLTGIALLADGGWRTTLVLAFALSFSSTVFAVKALEDRSDTRSFYGRIAIGVLVMQDVFAVVFITASSGELPSPWAVLLLGLIPATPLLRALLPRVGHSEMQILYGVVLALVVGYALFDSVGIKGDLGALIVGMLLAPHPSANGLSKALFQMKELFLVGFFVSIGLMALPTWSSFGIAALLLILLPLKGVLFAFLFNGFRVRYRTALLSTLALTNFSEFGLIVAAIAVGKGWMSADWLVVMSLTVALSLVLAALLDTRSHAIHDWLVPKLPAQDPVRLHPNDRPIELGDARAVVLGMGRVGRGAYDRIVEHYGVPTLGIDSDEDKVTELKALGYNIIEADASDSDFWDKLTWSDQVELVLLAMPDHAGNFYAIEELHNRACAGRIAAAIRYPEEAEVLRERGVDAVFHVYNEAGSALADSAAESAGLRPPA